MLSFRQKILVTNLFVVLIFLALMYPFANESVKTIIYRSLEERASELVGKFSEAKDIQDMIQILKAEKAQLFFRVSILNNKGGVIYDTHTKKVLRSSFQRGYIAHHTEVELALKLGTGYAQGYSSILDQEMTYVAKRFTAHGTTYVVRTAFPYKHVTAMTDYVVYSFSILGIAILLLYSLMTWFIIHHFTSPIQQIIQAVRPYQVGERENIPEIRLGSVTPSDEFYWLADTLNSLSAKVRAQIDTLIQERNEKEAILESLDEGVISVDEQMKIIYANDMALKMLDIKKSDILGQHFSILNKPQFHELLISCQDEQDIRQISSTLGKRPKYYLFVIAAPMGLKKGAILVLQDKSSHYRMLEMRKDFVANASHELKTPITIIQGFAETLHDNPELGREIFEEITKKIVCNCERMSTIVKNLLTLADIENLPRSKLQPCNLEHLIDSCKGEVLTVYPQTQIEVEKASDDVTLLADPDLLAVAIRNLFDNAAKYSTGPAQIKAHIERKEKHIVLSISDHGIGIPEEELENIFQRFYTINKKSKSPIKSSGLGLSIVETIIEKHFGKIIAQSKLGEGSTFTINLPIDRGEHL